MVVGGAVRLALLVVMLLAGCAATQEPPSTTPTATPGATGAPRLEPFLDGFTAPVLLTPDREGALYVVEQGGRILRLDGGARTLWLDLSAKVSGGSEQGLLGLAFGPEPDVAYVSYTDTEGDSVLSRLRHAGGRADPASETPLLQVDQPYSNHNGGHILFGPDGLLYYGLGDGGSAGDPQGNGQDPDALLGSILRLDVSEERPAPEIYAKGLRNPWRFHFDRATGELWIGDVGQNRVEEIDHLPANAPRGANFGWNVYEGNDRFSLFGRTFSTYTPPVFTYTHDDGCSVTAGVVHAGAFWFADYCSGNLWRLDRAGEGWEGTLVLATGLQVSSFGEDAEGNAYLVDHGGRVVRLVVERT